VAMLLDFFRSRLSMIQTIGEIVARCIAGAKK